MKRIRNVVTAAIAEADDRCGSCARHTGSPHTYNCPENPLPGRVYEVFLTNGHYDEAWLVRSRNKREAQRAAWKAHRADLDRVRTVRHYAENWGDGRFKTEYVETFDSTMEGMEKHDWQEMLEDYAEDLDKLIFLDRAVCVMDGT